MTLFIPTLPGLEGQFSAQPSPRPARRSGPYDSLIAAQARRRGATLATANEREFARVPGLTTEDWAG